METLLEPDAGVSITHAELVDIGRRWLSTPKAPTKQPWYPAWKHSALPIVVTEISEYESPDVIGWQNNFSWLIECKVSRSDFFADKKKPFRIRPDEGMGGRRFFLTPQGLVKPEEIPPKWGLLETNGKRVKVIKDCELFDVYNWKSEMRILQSILLRANIDAGRCMSLRPFLYESKNRTSLTLSETDE
jgi:hypothetical protein